MNLIWKPAKNDKDREYSIEANNNTQLVSK